MNAKSLSILVVSILILGVFLPAHADISELTISEALAVGGTLIILGHGFCEIRKQSSQVVKIETTKSTNKLSAQRCPPGTDQSQDRAAEIAAVLPVGLSAASHLLVVDNYIVANKKRK
jgi:hypothetical protein